jgi:hypothetical protein
MGKRKKPKPALLQGWLPAKAEFYLITLTVTEDRLGGAPPGVPPNVVMTASDGEFPDRFPAGVWVAADQKHASIIGEGEEGKFYSFTDDSLDKVKAVLPDSDMLQRLERIKGYATESEETFLLWLETVLGKEQAERIKEALLSAALNIGVPTVIFPIVLHHNDAARAREIWVKSGRFMGIVPSRERSGVEALLLRAYEEAKSEKALSDRAEDPNGRLQVSHDIIAKLVTSKAAVRAATLCKR